MREKNKKLSMENYLEYFYSDKQSDPKIEFLNQIISMHGFKRLKLPKSGSSQAVSGIELMNPSRSTLKENIAPGVSGSLNGVMEDLNDLSWKECSVTSVKIVKSRQAEGQKDNYHHNQKNDNRISKSSRVVVSVSGSAAASTSPRSADEHELEAGDKKPKKLKKSVPTSSLRAAIVEFSEQEKDSVPKGKRSSRAAVKSPLTASTGM